MNIEVGAKIKIANPDDNVIKWCKHNLVLDNPDFYKKQRLGKWTGNTPRQIVLYERVGNELWLPFGCVNELYAFLRSRGDGDIFSPVFCDFRRLNYESDIEPYLYQENAIQTILGRKNGVVVMPCGAGKTQTALEAVARIGGKALWLTHTQDLMNQSMNRAKSVLNINPKTYGTVTGGKVDIGESITFATVQTMSKLDLAQYENEFDVVIVDECHHAIGSPTKVMQFYKVLSNLRARYKIGLTATPKRADGLEQSMFALLGGIICEIDKSEVKDTICPVEVRGVETGYVPNYDAVLSGDGTINYAQLVEDLVSNEARFELVKNIIPVNQPTLVLASRVEYLKRLDEAYEGKSICLSTLGTSKKAKEIRKDALNKLGTGELDCIFATYQLAKEGLDCPNLRCLILATPEKDETTVTQAVGRVGRKADGKEYGVVIDLLDDFGMYKGWAKKRRGYYKKNDYTYIDIN